MKTNEETVRIYLPLAELDIRSKNRLFPEDNPGTGQFEREDLLKNI